MKSHFVFLFATLFAIVGLVWSCDSKKSDAQAGVYYTCPMHPEVKKVEPGQCPMCGMDLVEKK